MIAPLSHHLIPSGFLEKLKTSLNNTLTLCVHGILLVFLVSGLLTWGLGLSSSSFVVLSLALLLVLGSVLLMSLLNVRQKLFSSYLPSSPTVSVALPKPFLSVLRKLYPESIHNFCMEKQVAIWELESVLAALRAGDLSMMSAEVRNKVESFGWQSLQQACSTGGLPSLESILIQNCPWQFILKFVSLGEKSVPRETGLAPELYWTQNGENHIFNHFTWLFSHVVLQEEYAQLLLHVEEDRIHFSQEGLLKSLAERMRAFSDTVPNDLSKEQKEELKACIVCDPRGLLSYLLRLRVNWEQILLFKQLSFDCAYVCSLYSFAVEEVINELREDSPEYDPEIALLTWEDGDPLGVAEERRLMGIL